MRGAEWVAPDRYEIAKTAMRYEDWEFSYALIFGLGAAARYALEVGVQTAGARAFELARRVRAKISKIPGARVLDDGREQCAIVTASFPGVDARDLVRELRLRKVNTAASLRWYGLLDFSERQVDTAIRISPHYYNTEAEVDSAIETLTDVLGELA
jgi:selenocysteine lyase/cysteine desulfurase